MESGRASELLVVSCKFPSQRALLSGLALELWWLHYVRLSETGQHWHSQHTQKPGWTGGTEGGEAIEPTGAAAESPCVQHTLTHAHTLSSKSRHQLAFGQVRIPSVLDCVVGTAGQQLSYQCPPAACRLRIAQGYKNSLPIAILAIGSHNDFIFLVCPGRLFYSRI